MFGDVLNSLGKSSNVVGDQQQLKDDEEIIGVHGSKGESEIAALKNLGFIVWIPPKF